MNAIVYTEYGGPDVLRLDDIETPTPGPGEVRVRVVAAGVARGDVHLLRGTPFLVRMMFGVQRPKLRVLGSDVAGVVDAVGEGVQDFQVGDEVFGQLADAGFGGWAEFVVAPVEALVPKPPALSMEDAAALPGSALAALQGLRDKGEIQAGQSVLVNGASGGVGSMAIQIAKSMGAEVTAVCGTKNVDMVRGLGADHVIDYTREDFRDGSRQWDVVLDAAAHRPVRESLRAVAPGGKYVFVGGATGPTMEAMLLGPVLSMVTGKKVRFFISAPKKADLDAIQALAVEGTVAPVIGGRYALADAATAIGDLEARRVRGKLVLTVGEME